MLNAFHLVTYCISLELYNISFGGFLQSVS